MDFAFLGDHRVKLKKKQKKNTKKQKQKTKQKIDKYLDFARELKTMKHKMTVIPIVIGALGAVTKGLVKGLEELGNKRTSGDHPNYSIIKIGKNTEKSPGDLRRLDVAQTPVRKSLKREK